MLNLSVCSKQSPFFQVWMHLLKKKSFTCGQIASYFFVDWSTHLCGLCNPFEAKIYPSNK